MSHRNKCQILADCGGPKEHPTIIRLLCDSDEAFDDPMDICRYQRMREGGTCIYREDERCTNLRACMEMTRRLVSKVHTLEKRLEAKIERARKKGLDV